MFEAYTTTTATYATNDAVAFTDVRYRDSRILTASQTSLKLYVPGRYLVIFHAVAASNTAASPFTVALYKDNVAIPGVETTITSTAAGNEQTMSLSTIINVAPSCCYVNNEVNLRLIATSTEPGTITSGNLVIVRL